MGALKLPKISITRRRSFSSAHLYHQPAWNDQKNRDVFGDCFSKHGHGHNYILECCFEGEIDPLTGMILNLVEIDNLMNTVLVELDHKHLNFEVEHFKSHIPTTENIALYCFNKIQALFAKGRNKNAQIISVRVYETETLFAEVTTR